MRTKWIVVGALATGALVLYTTKTKTKAVKPEDEPIQCPESKDEVLRLFVSSTHKEITLGCKTLLQCNANALPKGLLVDVAPLLVTVIRDTKLPRENALLACRALRRIITSSHSRDAALDADGHLACKELCEGLAMKDADVAAGVCSCVARLAFTDRGEELCIKADMAHPLLALMHIHVENKVVAREACRALANISYSPAGEEATMNIEESLTHIAAVVRVHIDDIPCCTEAVRAIEYLVIKEEGRKRALHSGIPVLLRGLLERVVAVPKSNGALALTMTLAKACGRMACQPEARAGLVAEAVPGLAVRVLKKYSSNGPAARALCITIENISGSGEGEKAAVNEGAPQCLLEVIRAHTDETARFQAYRALRNVVASPAGVQSAVTAGGVAVCVNELLGEGGAKVTEAAARVVANVACDFTGRTACIEGNVGDAIIKAVGRLGGAATAPDLLVAGCCDALDSIARSPEGIHHVVAVGGREMARGVTERGDLVGSPPPMMQARSEAKKVATGLLRLLQ